MKAGWSLMRFLTVIAVCAFAVGACAPVPFVPPGGQTPAVSVFLPGVEQPGVALSPLQPTAIVTEQTRLVPTAVAPSSGTPEPAIIGPVWQWVSSIFQDGAVLAPGDPSRYSFQLLPDGNALVQADCNFGSATYQETLESLTFGPIGTTKMACPPDSLDSEFLGQLRNLDRYEFDSDGLLIYLLDDAGSMQLRAVAAEAGVEITPSAPVTLTVNAATPSPASSPAVVETAAVPVPTLPLTSTLPAGLVGGTGWTLANLSVNGQATALVEGTTVTMEVAADGSRISGSTGCNQYRAMLTTEAAGMSIVGPALLTRKTCTASTRVQEVEFIDALLRTRGFAMSEDELTLFAEDDEPLLVFVRK